MNDDNSPTGDTATDNFMRSNTVKIPAVLALDGADAVAIIAGMITNPVRIPVRIEHSQSGSAGADDPVEETQEAAPAFPVSSEPSGEEHYPDEGGSMAPRRRRR
jgi:hypothetical protein